MVLTVPEQRHGRILSQHLGNDTQAVNIRKDPAQCHPYPVPARDLEGIGDGPADQEMACRIHYPLVFHALTQIGIVRLFEAGDVRLVLERQIDIIQTVEQLLLVAGFDGE